MYFTGGVLGLLFVASPTWCQMLGMVFAAALGDFVSVHFKKDYTGERQSVDVLICCQMQHTSKCHNRQCAKQASQCASSIRLKCVLPPPACLFLEHTLCRPPDTNYLCHCCERRG